MPSTYNGKVDFQGDGKVVRPNGKGTVDFDPPWNFTTRYEGEFEHGHLTGHGKSIYGNASAEPETDEVAYYDKIVTKSNGTVEIDGPPVYLDDYYEGRHEDGDPDGRGTWYRRDGRKIYEGEWNKGYCHGHGILYGLNGQVKIYEGGWNKGYFHGRGILYGRDGEPAGPEGWWNNGRPVEVPPEDCGDGPADEDC